MSFFLLEESLSSEGNGMPKEEKLPEDSKSPPLSPASSVTPDSRNPVSAYTAVSRDFSPSVPGPSSSALVGTKSTKSSQHEVKFQTQKKSEGIFKNSDSQPVCSFTPQVFHAQKYPLRVYDIGESAKIEEFESSLFMSLSGSGQYRWL